MSRPRPLAGRRVVDLSTWIAGGYCTKLLADAGADVVKVESGEGDPLRRWSASGARIEAPDSGALFNFLHARKTTLVADVDTLEQHLSGADAVVWSRDATLPVIPAELMERHPGLRMVAITPFGLDGPWADRAATEFTLQAWSGGMIGLGRGYADRAPVYVGGQIGEWLAGVFAAVGLLASLRRGGDTGELLDVSMLEAEATCLTYYPVSYHDQMGRPMRKRRFVPSPGVAEAADGMVGLGVGTGQQWYDFCAMVGHPEWTEDPKLFLDRTSLMPTIDAWIAEQKVDELLELATAFRIPNAPLVNGANAESVEHFRSRGAFVPNPIDGVTNPAPPYRLTPAASESGAPRPMRAGGTLPLRGLRVLDMTAFWAGPFVGSVLGMLGAEVVHLESAGRPDGARLIGGIPQTTEQFWERGPIFSALNTNKLSLTIDLSQPRGLELLKQFVATCDVVVENFTPRVLDQLGLSYEVLRESRPDLVMLRMPGFGLDGPWRDVAAFAFVIEDASGMTWLTGYPDRLPIEPYCVGDPNAGLHALTALLVALAHRDQTGEGSLVEAAMVDAALNVAAEQVIEHSAYGALLERTGNRGPLAAPQNVYQAAGPDDDGHDDSWVAIAVATDEQWLALRQALGDPQWAREPQLATAAGRRAAHDLLDEQLGAWCRARSADDVVAALWPAGVPVAKVMQPHQQPDLPQVAERGFFEVLDHPVVGSCRYSTLPIRFSAITEPLQRRHAPLLGEHNEQLLAELGLSRSDIEELAAAGIIGNAVTPVSGH
ncbi:MAG TPA: CoA transferase [Mycobacteriales bacterium]|nr:CoA transferase [Mycobacteriales bacterium]